MNNQEKLFKIGKWVGLFIIIFLAITSIKQLVSIEYVGKDTPIMNLITVSGKGEVISVPDIATVSFSVTEKDKTVGDAQTKATKKINDVLKLIKEKGVAEKDIKTLSYFINPHYEYITIMCIQYPCPGGKSELTGYEVSQTIEIKIRDLTKAGDLLGVIGSAGVQTVNNLNFTIDDIDSLKAEARTKAIEDAKLKAKKISKELGVKLVRITNFYDSGNEMPYYGMGEAKADIMSVSSARAPEIPKGEQKVTSNISITYEIR